MAKHRRRFRALAALALLGSGSGCRNATLCEPTSPLLGQLVASGVSEKYLAQVDKAGGDVPHMACEAETTIITPRLYLRESEDGNCQSTGKYCLGGVDDAYRWKTPMSLPMDQTSVESKSPMQVLQSEFRIVGIGKGITIEDCSETALRACNVGHDAYYDQQRGVRPLASGCRMAENQNMCTPGGRMPRASVASTPPPTVSPEELLPATWIARLGDVEKRPVAIRALIHFHSDAMLRSHQNAGDAVVKSVVDDIVEPLANVYVEGQLERSTRVLVIRFLAETRDPRAGRAFIHACHGFATATGPDEEDVQHASLAIAALKFEEAAPALGEAFAKVETGTANGFRASKNVKLAMMQLKSPAWKPMLLEKIGAPIDRPPPSADAEQVARYQTQVFWQQTSAELLGAFGETSAAGPLLKILMDRGKAEIAGSALLGIVKIGRSAVPLLTDVLAGRDAQMVDFAKSKAAAAGGNAKSYVMASAVALGAMGRADARAAMIQALRASDSEVNRAVLARELTALPANAESIKAFQAGYAKVPPPTRIWPSMSAAQPALLAASARFYESEIVPWLLRQASAAKNKDEETMSAALKSAILSMRGAHTAKVQIVVDKIGGEREKSAFRAASELLGKCGENVECYLSKLNEEDASDPFAAVKAAHMVGMLGDARAGMELVKFLPKLRQDDVLTAALLAVDHAAQNDAATVADALQKIVEDPARDGALATPAAEEVVYRLRAR